MGKMGPRGSVGEAPEGPRGDPGTRGPKGVKGPAGVRGQPGKGRNFRSKTKYSAMQVYKLCIRALQISIPKKVYLFTTKNSTFLTSKDEILHCSRSNYTV